MELVVRPLFEQSDARPDEYTRSFINPDDGLFCKLAAYGHVGREDLDLPWERTDQVEALRSI